MSEFYAIAYGGPAILLLILFMKGYNMTKIDTSVSKPVQPTFMMVMGGYSLMILSVILLFVFLWFVYKKPETPVNKH